MSLAIRSTTGEHGEAHVFRQAPAALGQRLHADDLRAEGADDETARHAQGDYRRAGLSPRERAVCDFAVKLTTLAAEIDETDVDALRAEGLSDPEISDAIQVIGYFNYVTRVADGVGIDDEPEWRLGPR